MAPSTLIDELAANDYTAWEDYTKLLKRIHRLSDPILSDPILI